MLPTAIKRYGSATMTRPETSWVIDRIEGFSPTGMPRHNYPMTIVGQFITVLQQEQRIGNVSSETEQHLKHEFRKLGRDASGPTLAAAVEAEINRLVRQADTLRRLQATLPALV